DGKLLPAFPYGRKPAMFLSRLSMRLRKQEERLRRARIEMWSFSSFECGRSFVRSARLALEGVLIQIVHFYESNADNDVLATHDRGVVTRWESCNDRRLAWLSRGMPAVLDSADLVSSDDAADYCMLPVIIRANQCLSAVVQF